MLTILHNVFCNQIPESKEQLLHLIFDQMQQGKIGESNKYINLLVRRMEELMQIQQQIMNSQLIIREGIIFFDSEIQFHSKINVKLCFNSEIHKFSDFCWSPSCRRWQRKNQLRIPWPQCQQINLQVYYQQSTGKQVVLGQGRIKVGTIMGYLNKQMKVILTYDGLYVGSLYWQILNCQEQDVSLAKNFLYLHKMDVILLDDSPHAFVMRVMRNSEAVYEKDFHLHQKCKYLFPNIKIPVKMSDVFTISVQHNRIDIKDVKFLVDSIKRGKTSTYEVWLRNKLRVKVGDLKIQYFLQNLYLQNERQIFTRNGIFGQSVVSNINTTLSELDKQKLRRSVIIKSIIEADKRFMKLDKSMRKMIKNMEGKQHKQTGQTKKSMFKQQTMKQMKQNITYLKPIKSIRFEDAQ